MHSRLRGYRNSFYRARKDFVKTAGDGREGLFSVANYRVMCYIFPMKRTHAEFALLSPLPVEEVLKIHPMSLAFIGDAVHSLYVRTAVTVQSGDVKTGALHKKVTGCVSAVAQAAASEEISALFDDVEADVFRRARNCHIQTSAKHAERAEYRRASGLEAVLGYLYLTGNTERLVRFLKMTAEDNL